uniref:Uncharacterized protein LOC107434956 isoform X1 n=1 Tax=Rhizophora mucronata TaxID=61149 RepID=A0A2P2J069_RHIMU
MILCTSRTWIYPYIHVCWFAKQLICNYSILRSWSRRQAG